MKSLPTYDSDDWLALVERCRADAVARGFRSTVVFAGAPDWGWRLLACLMDGETYPLVVSDSASVRVKGVCIRHTEATKHLGTERDTVIYDAHIAFDPDGFGAVCGTLRAGGRLILLTPPLDAWPGRVDVALERIAPYPTTAADFSGRFIGRVAATLRTHPGVAIVTPQGCRYHAPPESPAPAPVSVSDRQCLTQDQADAVAATLRAARGHRRRPLVLTADRGRGKSAALGIAAARLIAQRRLSIVVTAPRRSAADAVFEHARRLLAQARGVAAGHSFRPDELYFRAPDELIRTPHDADVLLVDEAAGLPAPILAALLSRYARIVFATTVHGYEGTGRGFDLRFRATLDRETPHWRPLRLETPIRWAAGDPLERLVFEALLLNAEPSATASIGDTDADDARIETLDRDELVQDEKTLSAVFGLLVAAHYRTRPMELRQLLDAPGLSVTVARTTCAVLGVALSALEGGFEAELAEEIWLGRRRPRGHLMAQSLAAHAGLPDAPQRRGLRVLRIAVHPAARRRGIGRRLIAAIAGDASAGGLDYLGSSFGVTAELLHFWRSCGLVTVRVGNRRDATSGSRSALVMRSLSPAGQRLYTTARARLAATLPYALAGSLQELEPELAVCLLSGLTIDAAPDEGDWSDLLAFAAGHRRFDDTAAALWRLALYAAVERRLAPLPATQRDSVVVCVLQRRGWSEAAVALGLSGRRAILDRLRAAAFRLIETLAPPITANRLQRLTRCDALAVKGVADYRVGGDGDDRQPR